MIHYVYHLVSIFVCLLFCVKQVLCSQLIFSFFLKTLLPINESESAPKPLSCGSQKQNGELKHFLEPQSMVIIFFCLFITFYITCRHFTVVTMTILIMCSFKYSLYTTLTSSIFFKFLLYCVSVTT